VSKVKFVNDPLTLAILAATILSGSEFHILITPDINNTNTKKILITLRNNRQFSYLNRFPWVVGYGEGLKKHEDSRSTRPCNTL